MKVPTGGYSTGEMYCENQFPPALTHLSLRVDFFRENAFIWNIYFHIWTINGNYRAISKY